MRLQIWVMARASLGFLELLSPTQFSSACSCDKCVFMHRHRTAKPGSMCFHVLPRRSYRGGLDGKTIHIKINTYIRGRSVYYITSRRRYYINIITPDSRLPTPRISLLFILPTTLPRRIAVKSLPILLFLSMSMFLLRHTAPFPISIAYELITHRIVENS